MTNQARRFTAEKIQGEADAWRREGYDHTADVLDQAATTEAQVAWLVEALVASLEWMDEAQPALRRLDDGGNFDGAPVNQVREAISKFRGEDA